MPRPWLRLSALLLFVLTVLAACQGPAPRPGTGADPLQARREVLRAQPAWQLEGRVSLSDGRDAVTLRLQWRQEVDRYELLLRAPVTGAPWRLSGDSRGAVLEGGAKGPLRGADAEALLRRESGYRIPLAAMTDWVRGLSHDPRRAEVALREDGLPALLSESGWRIRYRTFEADHKPLPLPLQLEAEQGSYRVRLAISSWGPENGRE